MTRRAYRKDRTEAPAVRDIRSIGWRVEVLSDWGYTADLLVCVGSDLYLVDMKASAKSPLTASQTRLLQDGWPLIVAVDGPDAIRQISDRRRAVAP